MLPIMLDTAPPATELLADKAYDSDAIREDLLERGRRPVIANKDDRSFFHPFDRKCYRDRNAIERIFCRLTGFRRIATRYDKLAKTYLASLGIAVRSGERLALSCAYPSDIMLLKSHPLNGSPA